jgi:hypothetical protein
VNGSEPVREFCARAVEDAWYRYEHEPDLVPTFGLTDLDTMIGPIRAGSVLALVSPPCVAKTALMWHAALTSADLGRRVLMVLDRPVGVLAAHPPLGARAAVSLRNFRTGRLTAADAASIERAIAGLPEKLIVRVGPRLAPWEAYVGSDDFELVVVEADSALAPQRRHRSAELLASFATTSGVTTIVSAPSLRTSELADGHSDPLADVVDSALTFEGVPRASGSPWSCLEITLLENRLQERSSCRLAFDRSTARLAGFVDDSASVI